MVLVLNPFDKFVVVPAYVQVLVVFELSLDLLLHFSKVPRILGSFYFLAGQFLSQTVHLALQLHVLLLQLLRRVKTVLPNAHGLASVVLQVCARGCYSLGWSQSLYGLCV